MLLRPSLGGALPLAAALLLLAPADADAQRARAGLDLTRPVTYFIARGAADSGFREGDETLARWAIEAWVRRADPTVELRPAPEATARLRGYWVPAGGGQYGEMRPRRLEDGSVGADVFVRPDTDGLGPGIARAARADPLFRDTIVYLTCVHELGHALGLPHTADYADIMYSFQFGGDFVAYFGRFRERLGTREDIPRASPFSAGDLAALRAAGR